jgi:hypothetical protein
MVMSAEIRKINESLARHPGLLDATAMLDLELNTRVNFAGVSTS